MERKLVQIGSSLAVTLPVDVVKDFQAEERAEASRSRSIPSRESSAFSWA
ncbi:MAG: hypothetical protein IPP07_30300 [Holophagales bacterium]|nr:hypothetical protein [Holophagales bacterium]